MTHPAFDLQNRRRICRIIDDTHEYFNELSCRMNEFDGELATMQAEITAIREGRPSSPSPVEDNDPLPFQQRR